MSNSPCVVVVGGGIAGMIAAIDLAKGGARVTLLERAAEFGGRAATREVGGFAFNQGPHALYNDGAFRKTLAEFKIDFTAAPPRFGRESALWGDELHALPRNLSAILAGSPLTWPERIRLLRLFVMLPRLDLGLWRGRPLSAFTAPLPERVRALIHALARLSTYAHAPDRLDAAATLSQLRLATAGVVYVDGGWRRLVDGLIACAREAGAALRLEAPVERLQPIAAGWRLNGALVADAVVLAAPPSACAALLPDSKTLAAAVRAAVPARTIALDYGLRRLPRPDATFALGVNQPLYFSVHSASARLAPQNSALIHAARYLAPEESADAAAVETVKTLVARMQPGFEPEIAQSARLIGMPVAFDAPYAARGGRMAPIAIEDAPGVFLAGDWVGEGAMLSDAAAKSAREAAAKALDFAKAPARAAA